jgi:AcrR family transcriptional regulator
MPPRTQLKPRKRPLQARSKATVDAILSGAAQVLKRKGYAAATTDRIAERAGVSVGSLYQYFPNKDAILVALAERHIDEGFALVRELLVEALREAPPAELLLRRFVVAMVALHENEPELHRVLFEEVPLPASVRRGLRKRENEFATEVCALLEVHPEVRMKEPRVTAYVLVHTVDALVHNFVLHPPKDIGTEQLTEEVVRMLLRHLLVDESS